MKFPTILSLTLSLLMLFPIDSHCSDWLLGEGNYRSVVSEFDGRLTITNNLISRTILLSNGTTIAFDNLITNESIIRSIRPEGTLQINGLDISIGGLLGQPIHNYLLPEWLNKMTPDPKSIKFDSYKVSNITSRFDWKPRKTWMSFPAILSPKGKEITLIYKNQQVTIEVHYEIYDNLPLISKWLSVTNNSGKEIIVNKFTSEILALTEPENTVGTKKPFYERPNIAIETDYNFGGDMFAENNYDEVIHWMADPLYKTQVSYINDVPCLVEVRPKHGPQQTVEPGKTFSTFRTYELIYDSLDRERKGLARRKMYRTIAPWVQENPIFMHVRRADSESVKTAIDQAAEVGFEMVILTFGSGFNIEDNSEKNLNRMKELADYAHSKGIALGGYSLLASRKISAKDDVVNPKPRFENSPCLESQWGQDYFARLKNFYEKTGFDVLEHDGSYPGDTCASTTHPGHKGFEDSQWNQYRQVSDFYRWCKSNSIYLNVPDWYFLEGSNKVGMGYRETNWSLPREQQEIIERQNVYDGTWFKTSSMGWMFVPLTQYHGGGADATIEPLKDHLPHYEQRLANLFGAGVQAAYRGPRLFDTPETKEVVTRWVTFYKKYRDILDSDIIHIRRPDGRDYDAIMHVNPALKRKGLLMIHNPLSESIKKEITVNLYYAGLKNKVMMREQEGKLKAYKLDREYNIKLLIDIPAKSRSWFVME